MKVKHLMCSLIVVLAITACNNQEPITNNNEPIQPNTTVVVQNEPCHHIYDSMTITQEASCSVNGKALLTCTLCDYQEYSEIPAIGHHTEIAISPVAATCEASGLTEGRLCSICNAVIVKQQVIPKTEHNSSNWIVEKEATCTSNGSRYKVCTSCGKTLTSESIDKKGHDIITDTAITPTCTQSGLTEGSHCSTCDSIIVEQTAVSPIGHTESIIYGKTSSCIETGLTNGKICSTCGEILVKQDIIPTIDHVTSDWVIIQEATSDTSGAKQKTCTLCNLVIETEIIPIKAHKYVHFTTKPTCTSQGYTTHLCTECGDSYIDSYTPAGSHVMSEWIIDKPATCSEKGTQHRECLICRQILTTTHIKTTEHDYISEVIKPTDIEKGYTLHTCKNCNYSYKDSYINTCSHDWEELEVVSQATCTTEGEIKYKCSECDKIKTETISALGHTESNWIVDTSATCLSVGSRHKECTLCKITLLTEELAKSNHTESDWIVNSEATCSSVGNKHTECTVCNEIIQTQEIPKGSHSYISEYINSTPAKVKYTCSICSDSYEKDVQPLTVSIAITSRTQSSVSIGGFSNVVYGREFEAYASGGYGSIQYKFEVQGGSSDLVKDFSSSNTYGLSFKNRKPSGVVIVTVKDSYGNTATSSITID